MSIRPTCWPLRGGFYASGGDIFGQKKREWFG